MIDVDVAPGVVVRMTREEQIHFDSVLCKMGFESQWNEYSPEQRQIWLENMLARRRTEESHKKYQARKIKPKTKAQQKEIHARYLKNIKGLTLTVLRKLDFDELKAMYEREQRLVATIGVQPKPTTDDVVRSEAKLKGIHDKKYGTELKSFSRKRKSTKNAYDEMKKRLKESEKEKETEKNDTEVHTDVPSTADSENEEEMDENAMVILDTVIVEPLAVDFPIIDWYHDLDESGKRCYRIVRAGEGSETETYRNFAAMLKVFRRKDVDELFEVGLRKYEGVRGYDDSFQLYEHLRQMYMPEREMRIFMKADSPITFWYCYESCGIHVYHQKDGSIGYFLIGKVYPWSLGTMFDMLASKMKCSSLELGSQLRKDLNEYIRLHKESQKKE